MMTKMMPGPRVRMTAGAMPAYQRRSDRRIAAAIDAQPSPRVQAARSLTALHVGAEHCGTFVSSPLLHDVPRRHDVHGLKTALHTCYLHGDARKYRVPTLVGPRTGIAGRHSLPPGECRCWEVSYIWPPCQIGRTRSVAADLVKRPKRWERRG